MGLFIVLALLGSYFFVRYHEIIMNSLLILILMGLTATITVSFRLSVMRLLDPLSKWWLLLSFVVWIAAFYMLLELSNTKFSSVDTSSVGNYLNSVGIDGVGKFLYQGVGTLAICLPIMFSFSILTHMFAFASYRAREGKISSFFIRITKGFVTSPITTTLVIICLCGLSIFLVSGAAYNFIISSNPFETFTEKVK